MSLCRIGSPRKIETRVGKSISIVRRVRGRVSMYTPTLTMQDIRKAVSSSKSSLFLSSTTSSSGEYKNIINVSCVFKNSYYCLFKYRKSTYESLFLAICCTLIVFQTTRFLLRQSTIRNTERARIGEVTTELPSATSGTDLVSSKLPHPQIINLQQPLELQSKQSFPLRFQSKQVFHINIKL